ncbi:hypothetical protein [Mucisphaera sp.]|uniref:hypothetical protein n=1 Tax=Mucisphaera sp. TaxID=2913024 RepID=UPI003D121934
MLRRCSLALAVTVVPVLWFGSSTAYSQDDFPTAAELLTQGINQLSTGDFESARDSLGRVDRMQLNRADRLRLDRALRDLREGRVTVAPEPVAAEPAPVAAEPAEPVAVEPEPVAPVQTAEDLLAEADALAVSGDVADQREALDLYRALMNHEDASLDIRSLAAARHAQLNRSLNSSLTVARRAIDLAADDVRSGRLAAAQRKLDDVNASGVQLTWFDRHRMDSLRAEIGNVTMAAADAPTPALPVAAPAVAGPSGTAVSAPTDLLQQARRILSQEKFAEGEEAQRQGQLDLAVRLYEEAIALDSANIEAQQALPAVAASLASNQQRADALSTDALIRQVRQESAIAAFDQAINEANASASALNYAAALDAVARAQQVLDRNRQWISPDRLAGLREQAAQMQAALITDRDRHQAELTLQIERRRRAEQETDRLRELQTRREQVDQLLIRAHELKASQNYDEALEVVEQALFIEPTSFAGELLKTTIVNDRALVTSRQLSAQRRQAMMELSLENRAKIIPNPEPLVYPTDWPELTQRRLDNLPGGGDTEGTRNTIRLLRQDISVTFDQNTFESVIDQLQILTGANFFVNWNALEIAGIDRDALVSLNLNNVSAERVLRLVLQQLSNDFERLAFSVIDGVVTVSTELDLRSVSELRVYDIRDLLVQIPNFTGAPDFDLTAALESQEGGSSIFSEGDEENDDDEQLREEAIEEIELLVQQSVGTPDEWLNQESTLQELNGQLIVRTSPENHRQVSQLLNDIREARSSQITVEARLLLVDENFLEDIGFDVDFRLNNLGSSYTSLSVAQDSATIAAPTGTGNTPASFLPTQAMGSIFQDIPGSTTFNPATGFASTNRALELGVAYLDDLEVSLLVRATQNHARSISLTAPHVTFANGQRSYIFVARQTGFISDLEVVSDALAFDPEVEVFSTGVILDVEGTISADRRYVTLTLRPSLSSLTQLRQIPFTGTVDLDTGDDDDSDVPIPIQGFIELPELEVTQIRATVSIPDRGTLLVGGQRLIGEVEVESGVPILSKIPVVKRLFSNYSTVKDERTLLVLVKPTIIILNEEEELRFPGLLQDPALYNEGRGRGF